MGEQVAARVFSREDRQQYRLKVRACLDVFARMLAESRFDAETRSFGLEIELNLTDEPGDPSLANAAALEAIADPDFQTRSASSTSRSTSRPDCSAGLSSPSWKNSCAGQPEPRWDELARGTGAHMMVIGILPTVTERHLNAELQPRCALRVAQRADPAARGEDLHISIAGVERLLDLRRHDRARGRVYERLAASWSRSNFADYWNASQAIAGVQAAVGANSPFFFGCGARRASPCSSRRPTPGRRS